MSQISNESNQRLHEKYKLIFLANLLLKSFVLNYPNTLAMQ